MGLFDKNKKGGFMDQIRCDEPSYLVWKWHPAGSHLGENYRENAIRWGSSLRVKEGEVAVFVYKQQEGKMQDFIVGPFDETLKTANFPVLTCIVSLAYDGGTPFQAEVYFINLARIIQVKFAVPFFEVFDPRFADFGVPVAVRGTISFKIDDYREFIKLNRLRGFKIEDFQKQIQNAVTRYVKAVVANAPSENKIPLVQIESKTTQINDLIEDDLALRLKVNFGVSVSGIDIGAIELDKMSDGYKHLMAVTKDLTAMSMEALAVTNIKNIQDIQRIESEDYQENLRIEREEGQYSQRKKTQTANFLAYQTEAQTEVGVAGANALGQMGSKGAGEIDLGGCGAGFNPAGVMAGMAVGGAIGQNIVGTINNMMSGVNESQPASAIPETSVMSINEQIETLKKLKELFDSGIISAEEFELKKKEIMGL